MHLGPRGGNAQVSLRSSRVGVARAVLFGRRRTDCLGATLVLGAHLLQHNELSAALDLSDTIALTFNTHLEWVLEQLLDRLHLATVLSHATAAQQVCHASLCQPRVVEASAVIVPGLLIHTDLPGARIEQQVWDQVALATRSSYIDRTDSLSFLCTTTHRVLEPGRERERLDLLAAVELCHNLAWVQPGFPKHGRHDYSECRQ
eukprot:989390-Prymnesium_polylepis.1